LETETRRPQAEPRNAQDGLTSQAGCLIDVAPMPNTTVRAARLADIDQIITGYEWLFEPPASCPPQWDPECAAAALRRAISSHSAVVLIATLDGHLVGLCTAYDDIESVRFGRRVWVEDLALHPDQRSRGIGKQLLDEAKRWAQTRGATRLQLDSSEARTNAHRFYERERPDWRSISFGWEL
jgi:GNAT superfamily N-acetyltransferase